MLMLAIVAVVLVADEIAVLVMLVVVLDTEVLLIEVVYETAEETDTVVGGKSGDSAGVVERSTLSTCG